MKWMKSIKIKAQAQDELSRDVERCGDEARKRRKKRKKSMRPEANSGGCSHEAKRRGKDWCDENGNAG